jgi:hypothetical protein
MNAGILDTHFMHGVSPSKLGPMHNTLQMIPLILPQWPMKLTSVRFPGQTVAIVVKWEWSSLECSALDPGLSLIMIKYIHDPPHDPEVRNNLFWSVFSLVISKYALYDVSMFFCFLHIGTVSGETSCYTHMWHVNVAYTQNNTIYDPSPVIYIYYSLATHIWKSLWSKYGIFNLTNVYLSYTSCSNKLILCLAVKWDFSYVTNDLNHLHCNKTP